MSIEAKKQYQRQWYAKNKDRLALRAASYRQHNKDKLSKYRRTIVGRFSAAKSKAHIRKLAWELSIQDYSLLVSKGRCYYCLGSLPKASTALDRIDNNKGYIASNVVPCCRRCNVAKSDMTLREFVRWIQKVYKNASSYRH